MSRHPFYKIIKNHSKLEHSNNHDVKGNPLLQWFQDGFVGWDEPLQTYFIQAIEVGDDLEWWFGTSPREIPTFNDLCLIINEIFNNEVNFKFIDVIDKSMEGY